MRQTLLQFIRFGIVGTAGLFVDMGVLWLAMNALGLDRYSGRVLSFVAAATATWIGNRLFTFRGNHRGHPARQWGKFVFAAIGGFVVNYGTYAFMQHFIVPPQWVSDFWPYVGVAAGSIAGLLVNFYVAKRFVFC